MASIYSSFRSLAAILSTGVVLILVALRLCQEPTPFQFSSGPGTPRMRLAHPETFGYVRGQLLEESLAAQEAIHVPKSQSRGRDLVDPRPESLVTFAHLIEILDAN